MNFERFTPHLSPAYDAGGKLQNLTVHTETYCDGKQLAFPTPKVKLRLFRGRGQAENPLSFYPDTIALVTRQMQRPRMGRRRSFPGATAGSHKFAPYMGRRG
ncbi:hypothetical protein LMG27198_45090 [Methylocystis echinoides]|uniref:Uncharacterized protein n=1 Tax=Methylocystis echinoides TaxID=29468 RepID=A0A9W6GYL9_9HYPH|nr:hypothetical protein LMG27198_45090 [Methylocystis echinoides]